MRQCAWHSKHENLLVFILESVFDLIPQKDKERLNAAKSRAEGTIDVQSSSNTEKNSSDSHIHTSQTSVSSAVPAMESTAGTQSSPMATAGSQPSPMATAKEPSKLGTLQSPHTSRAAVFSPFVKDPEKQRRYDQYISLVKEGNPGMSTSSWSNIIAVHVHREGARNNIYYQVIEILPIL